MKFKLALAGLALAAVASGIWATRATSPNLDEQVVETSAATTAADLSLREMTQQAELVVTGQAVETRSAWIEDGRVLVTLVTVSVGETIKGDGAQTVTVVLPGGTDSNRRIPVAMTYAGAPQIYPQEEVFLFLNREEAVPDGYAVAGFAQGKYSINEDDKGQKVVSRDLTKVKLQSGAGIVRGNRQLTPLAEFKEKVRGYLR